MIGENEVEWNKQADVKTACFLVQCMQGYILAWWHLLRVRGFWENVRQFIPCLRFFFKMEIFWSGPTPGFIFKVDLLQALRGKKNFESSGFFADGALISASAYPISGSNERNHRELDRSALNWPRLIPSLRSLSDPAAINPLVFCFRGRNPTPSPCPKHYPTQVWEMGRREPGRADFVTTPPPTPVRPIDLTHSDQNFMFFSLGPRRSFLGAPTHGVQKERSLLCHVNGGVLLGRVGSLILTTRQTHRENVRTKFYKISIC